MLAVREGPARPVEKSQCNKERRDLRQTAREAIVARRTLGLMTVSSPSYGAALDVPSWLGEDVAAWIEEKRSSGDLIGCIVAPLEADAQCAALMRHAAFRDAYWLTIDNDTIAWGTEHTKFLRPVPDSVFVSPKVSGHESLLHRSPGRACWTPSPRAASSSSIMPYYYLRGTRSQSVQKLHVRSRTRSWPR